MSFAKLLKPGWIEESATAAPAALAALRDERTPTAATAASAATSTAPADTSDESDFDDLPNTHIGGFSEWIEERAGILEFDAGMPRGDAEHLAQQLWAARPAPSCGECQNLCRNGNCGQPVEAGLLRKGFEIVYPPEGHAVICSAFLRRLLH